MVLSAAADDDSLWLASGASAYMGLVVLSGLLGGMLSHALRAVLGKGPSAACQTPELAFLGLTYD